MSEGTTWNLVDARYTPKGIDPPPGGIVVVQGVSVLQVVGGRFVAGKTRSGDWFLMSLRDLDKDEPAANTVERFISEAEWEKACQSHDFQPPTLLDPSSIKDRR